MAFNDPVVLETDTVLTDTGGDSGTATDIGGAFSNVENLTGGGAADSFTLAGSRPAGDVVVTWPGMVVGAICPPVMP